MLSAKKKKSSEGSLKCQPALWPWLQEALQGPQERRWPLEAECCSVQPAVCVENADSNQRDREKPSGRGAAGGGPGRASADSVQHRAPGLGVKTLHAWACHVCLCVWRVCCTRASFPSMPVEGPGWCWSPLLRLLRGCCPCLPLTLWASVGSSVEWVLTSSKIGVPAWELQIPAPDFRAGLDPGTHQKPLQVKRECVTKQGSVLECRSQGSPFPRRSPPGLEYRWLPLRSILGENCRWFGRGHLT